jgi:prepilin-type N-terminal cleavage/methylation domain-containing protein
VFQRDDEGFSLVEVLMAMFLLAMLALAVLPLIIGITKVSAQNEDAAAANSFASAQLADLRSGFPSTARTGNSCEVLLALDGRQETDPAGTGNVATLDVPLVTCPSNEAFYPDAVEVSVTVRDSSGVQLVTASSLILVTEQSSGS